jgi:hypothetical protein
MFRVVNDFSPPQRSGGSQVVKYCAFVFVCARSRLRARNDIAFNPFARIVSVNTPTAHSPTHRFSLAASPTIQFYKRERLLDELTATTQCPLDINCTRLHYFLRQQ